MALSSFRFNSVLRHRKHKENEASRILSEKITLYEEECSQLNNLNTLRNYYQEELDQKEDTGIEGWRIETYMAYIEKLNDGIKNSRDNVRKRREDVNLSRKTLVEKSKDKKIIEKLKEKHTTNYLIEKNKIEQNSLDEIAGNFHERKSRGEQI